MLIWKPNGKVITQIVRIQNHSLNYPIAKLVFVDGKSCLIRIDALALIGGLNV